MDLTPIEAAHLWFDLSGVASLSPINYQYEEGMPVFTVWGLLLLDLLYLPVFTIDLWVIK